LFRKKSRLPRAPAAGVPVAPPVAADPRGAGFLDALAAASNRLTGSEVLAGSVGDCGAAAAGVACVAGAAGRAGGAVSLCKCSGIPYIFALDL